MDEWIDVDETMPNQCEDVLCLVVGDTSKYMDVLYYACGCWSRNVDVTHWMPLPNHPKP